MGCAGGGSEAAIAHDPERGVSSPYAGQSLIGALWVSREAGQKTDVSPGYS